MHYVRTVPAPAASQNGHRERRWRRSGARETQFLLDVVKTRLMTQAASANQPYSGVADCVATMWRTEGPRGFYRGLGQRAIYSGPLWASQFSLNARLSGALRERRRRLRAAEDR